MSENERKNGKDGRGEIIDDAVGYIVLLILAGFAILACFYASGCASKEVAKSLQGKTLSGDGIVAINTITVTDPAVGSFTPEIKSIFVSGKIYSILKGQTFLAYTRKQSASVFNASAVTQEESLVIQADKMPEVIRALAELEKRGASESVQAGEQARGSVQAGDPAK